MAIGNLKSVVQDVAVAGTAEAIVAADTYITSATIRAHTSNGGNVFIGDSTVDNTASPLTPGDSISLMNHYEFNLADIYVDSAVNGEGVAVWYFMK